MKPLVSILIPAYNAENTVAQSIQSALSQTWPHKEIIVVNDGSTDQTAETVRRFGTQVKLISTGNQGQSAAVNTAYRFSHGDYIQELDSDDILAPDKIERQLAALRTSDGPRTLLSSSWAPFFYRIDHARFLDTLLCQDLSPIEWLMRKMGSNLHMQNATWLVSRELAELAGPWNESLRYDQDGEYFDRLVAASDGVRFVQGTGVYYRQTSPGSVSWLGNSRIKRASLLDSIKLHIQYLLAIEDSERTRQVCLTYLQKYYADFYPDWTDMLRSIEAMAAQLQGSLREPRLRWKYAWIRPILGWKSANWAQTVIPLLKASVLRRYDKAMFSIEHEE